ncbi:hypothetical protein PR202_gb22798 [Eleusine coracana subsp. coracana]|uniref:Glycosyl hydrolase family 81 N-terminal domain-containing protein n=1 Tax=Eleusine coracana subsp. coracana TaxID=191504 RepID=A0AAV5FIN7_ELECO|nr:hypothetical protein PR202_gb22798 [Eleusine coracana subsp. coracana]
MVIPDTTRFFAPRLLNAPLPTNTFFQNFVLKNGDQPEYIHTYSIRSAADELTVCHPARTHSASLVDQPFVEDLTISFPSDANNGGHHRIVAFDDLSVTIDVSPSLRAHLVRSCPYVTLTTTKCVVDVALV